MKEAEAGKNIYAVSSARGGAVERLVFCLYLYPNYSVDSRGPYGCILNAIEKLDPDVAMRLKEGETPGEVHHSMWPDE